jgi:hypothetical protein
MSVACHFNGDILEMKLAGECPPDQIIDAFRRALDDPARPSKFGIFMDVRESTSLATRPAPEIIHVAEQLGPHKHLVARCAVLATEDIHFGLSRMGAVYSEAAGVMSRVFRDRDEALAWLRESPAS